MDKFNMLKDEYYLLIEPEDRKHYLDRKLQENPNDQVLALRKELFEIRYQKQGKKESLLYIDLFMKLWLDLAMEAANNFSGRRLKKAHAGFSAQVNALGLPAFREKSEEARDLLYCEMRHLVRTIIFSSENNKSYTRMFDLFPISKDRINEKINTDVRTAVIEYPEVIGLSQLLPELPEAAKDELEYYNSRRTLQNRR